MAYIGSAQDSGAVLSNEVRRTMLSARSAGFRVRVLGHSTARVSPQRVGQWWLESLGDPGNLPPRARYRLGAIVASGVRPKAVVIFHEIPTSTLSPVRPPTITTLDRAAIWVHRNLPGVADELRRKARQTAPHVGAALGAASVIVAAGAAAAVGLASLAVPVVVAAAVDPCLVVITDDGYWIEIDRWYE